MAVVSLTQQLQCRLGITFTSFGCSAVRESRCRTAARRPCAAARSHEPCHAQRQSGSHLPAGDRTGAARLCSGAAAVALAVALTAQPACADVSASFTRNCAGKDRHFRASLACALQPHVQETPRYHPIYDACSCTGCHAGGGNVVQAGASLSTGDLKRNGVADAKALYDLIYSGKGKMPGYGKDCAPRVRTSGLRVLMRAYPLAQCYI